MIGMRAIGETMPVYGICVRRDARRQGPRVRSWRRSSGRLIDRPAVFDAGDVEVCDMVHPPGYGKLNDSVREAMVMAARGAAPRPGVHRQGDGGPHRPCAFGAHRCGKSSALHPYRRIAGNLRVRGQARALALEGAGAPALTGW